jgi:uncharacterized protein
MSIWALSDCHLSFSTPSKDMSFFGAGWIDYAQKIEANWLACVHSEDLVLIPGDISWAMTLDEAMIDLEWLHKLPGIKLLLKGNHDYWWASNAKMQERLPSSIFFIHNNAFNWKHVTIGGSRLWDTEEYNFHSFIEFQENPRAKKAPPLSPESDKKLFLKELDRLKMSLGTLNPSASLRIALTHYPPIGADLKPSLASKILKDYRIDICIFGHLHNVKKDSLPFGVSDGIRYVFASCDYIDFKPLKIS